MKKTIYRLRAGRIKTCLIHSLGNSSDEYNVLGEFFDKYVKVKPTKDRGNHPIPRNKFNRNMENNSIVNSAVGEIIIHKTKKLSAAKETPDFLESYDDEN